MHLKLGLRVSPRTVRNHANAMLVCDFFVCITARLRTLYVFADLEIGTRRIVQREAEHRGVQLIMLPTAEAIKALAEGPTEDQRGPSCYVLIEPCLRTTTGGSLIVMHSVHGSRS